MLSRRDTLFLSKFLAAAYAESGYGEPVALARHTVAALGSSSTRTEAVTEVVRRCDRAEHAGGVMRLRAEIVRDILAHYLSRESDAGDTRLWPGSGPDHQVQGRLEGFDEGFWEEYERRFAAAAATAAREASALRLLDRCDPALLFSFYPLPEDAAD